MKTTYFIKTLLLTCCLIPAIMLAEKCISHPIKDRTA